jgi:hypothetical protein
LHEHSKTKFEELSSLLPGEQAELKNLLDDAYNLCLNEEATPDISDVKKALDNIRQIKRELGQIIAANQD